MSTERRRLIVVLARHAAVAPAGVDQDRFAAAALADSYEVAAELVDVDATIAGPADCAELLYPGVRLLPGDVELAALAEAAEQDSYDEVIFLPADVPDLPGLVLAKMFKALQRAAICVAPERDAAASPEAGGAMSSCLGIGLTLPVADWIQLPPDLDVDPRPALHRAAPRRSQVATTPDWRRLRTPEAAGHLDPALEGWEETRLLLLSSPRTGR